MSRGRDDIYFLLGAKKTPPKKQFVWVMVSFTLMCRCIKKTDAGNKAGGLREHLAGQSNKELS